MALRCERIKWRGRDACRSGNELVELTHLTGGGHIVDFHFTPWSRRPVVNPFWLPRWKTIEPFDFDARKHAKTYGPPAIGKTLASVAGHSLCLDLFGMPSEEETKEGATLHGEAGVSRWKASLRARAEQCEMHFSVRLAGAGLRFRRSLLLRRGESVVYIRETVENQRQIDQTFQWQQHAALGPPFLAPLDCVVGLPGARGLTFPAGYEERELLKSGNEFLWPYAPRFDRGRVDLRRTLTCPGRGFVAGVQVAPKRKTGFVCALNRKLALVVGYCFRREDFPWVALWEENRTRCYQPWRGLEQVRGLEFGASPLPLTRVENLLQGRVFGIPTVACVPAGSTRTASYVLFLASAPPGLRSIADVVVHSGSMTLVGPAGKVTHVVKADAIRDYVQ